MAVKPASDRAERLEAQLSALPQSPGVYLFRSDAGDVLYVGKAKSLRSRVRSYFRREAYATAKTAELVERIDTIEFVSAESETEALFLEQNLIKRHRPTFNIRLRDDKSYPYIAVTVADEYPRVMFTRERHRKTVQYFGPYSSAKKVRETLDVLNRVFPYRPCEVRRPAAAPACRASTTTSAGARPRAWATSPPRSTAPSSTRWSSSCRAGCVLSNAGSRRR